MTTFDRVIPLLVYQDIEAAHDFLTEAFGFTPGGVERTPDGQAVHAELQIGAMTIQYGHLVVEDSSRPHLLRYVNQENPWKWHANFPNALISRMERRTE